MLPIVREDSDPEQMGRINGTVHVVDLYLKAVLLKLVSKGQDKRTALLETAMALLANVSIIVGALIEIETEREINSVEMANALAEKVNEMWAIRKQNEASSNG